MSVVTEAHRDLVEATGRFTVYSLLATGLAFPTAERLELLSSRLLPAAAVLALPGDLGDALTAARSAAGTDLDEARHHHMRLFPPIASQDAPGYETGYRGDGIFQQAALMADIAGFYRAHGLRAGGSQRERVDHITVELEFMAYVARKETVAIRHGSLVEAEVCRDTSALFLQDHLGCWAPAFGRRAAAVATSPWLREIGHLIDVWVRYDALAFGVEPVERVDAPLPQEPPDDGSCGPCVVGAAGP